MVNRVNSVRLLGPRAPAHSDPRIPCARRALVQLLFTRMLCIRDSSKLSGPVGPYPPDQHRVPWTPRILDPRDLLDLPDVDRGPSLHVFRPEH